MVVHEQLSSVLKQLRLSSVLESLDLRVEQALQQPLSHQEFLVRLLQDELERRQARSLARRLRAAQFEGEKTLENFDFGFNPELPRAQLLELGCCRFLERKENVLLLGPAGVGKSHLAQALGHRAARAGHSVRFVGCHPLLEQLHAARADASLEKRLVELTKVDLLILDDLGLHALVGQQPMDLYELLRRRYEKGSLVITSNRDLDEWYGLFGDNLLASSAMDRLLHHGHILRLQGHSYRNPPTQRITTSEAG